MKEREEKREEKRESKAKGKERGRESFISENTKRLISESVRGEGKEREIEAERGEKRQKLFINFYFSAEKKVTSI